MLSALAEDAAALLQLQGPAPLVGVVAALRGDWRSEVAMMLAEPEWRGQLLAAAALVVGGGDAIVCTGLWQAIDTASWVAPQLIAAAFLADAAFGGRAEERLLGFTRRPPKTLGALVRAYHRLRRPRLPVVAQLGRHDHALASEEARVGIRGVDGWLDRLPIVCDAAVQSRWLRRPRVLS